MAVKNLHKLGNSSAIVLTRIDLEQLGVESGGRVRVTLEGSRLIVEAAPVGAALTGPRRGRRPQDADAAMEATLTTHADALATLADAGVLGHELS